MPNNLYKYFGGKVSEVWSAWEAASAAFALELKESINFLQLIKLNLLGSLTEFCLFGFISPPFPPKLMFVSSFLCLHVKSIRQSKMKTSEDRNHI